MAVVINGITAAAVERYIRGPGGLYKNFTSIAVPGTQLGETLGDSVFDPGYTYHDVDPAGARGKMKLHHVVDKINPTLAVSLLESTTTLMGAMIPGLDSTDETPTAIKGEYLGTGAGITVGVVLGHGTTGGAVDESTVEIWYTSVGLGDATKGTVGSDYQIVDQITLASATTGDEVVVGGLTYTGAIAEDQTAREFIATGDDTADAASLVLCINNATYGVPGVTATSALGVVTLTRASSGVPNTITQTGDHATMAYQIIKEVITGSIVDTDLITASYTYDSTNSGDAFTIWTPAEIATGDYWTNVALVCPLSNSTYSYPYFVIILKNVLNASAPITIPGDSVTEAQLKFTFEAYFDASVGTAVADAPFTWWIGRA